ncbi:MAG: ATP-binding protein [Cystobacter sp.]
MSLEEVQLDHVLDTAIADAVAEHECEDHEVHTARLSAEKAHEQMEPRVFKRLVEASSGYISLVDLQGRLLYINPARLRLARLSSMAQALSIHPKEMDQIARAHGGDVQVTSNKSEGTRFRVRLAGG